MAEAARMLSVLAILHSHEVRSVARLRMRSGALTGTEESPPARRATTTESATPKIVWLHQLQCLCAAQNVPLPFGNGFNTPPADTTTYLSIRPA